MLSSFSHAASFETEHRVTPEDTTAGNGVPPITDPHHGTVTRRKLHEQIRFCQGLTLFQRRTTLFPPTTRRSPLFSARNTTRRARHGSAGGRRFGRSSTALTGMLRAPSVSLRRFGTTVDGGRRMDQVPGKCFALVGPPECVWMCLISTSHVARDDVQTRWSFCRCSEWWQKPWRTPPRRRSFCRLGGRSRTGSIWAEFARFKTDPEPDVIGGVSDQNLALACPYGLVWLWVMRL